MGGLDAPLGELENVPLRVLSMNEGNYFMIPMSTYGENEQVGNNKFRNIGRVGIIFNIQKNVHNNQQSRDLVDSHNTRLEAHISLEERCSTRF